jgi:hypothetical protein
VREPINQRSMRTNRVGKINLILFIIAHLKRFDLKILEEGKNCSEGDVLQVSLGLVFTVKWGKLLGSFVNNNGLSSLTQEHKVKLLAK